MATSIMEVVMSGHFDESSSDFHICNWIPYGTTFTATEDNDGDGMYDKDELGYCAPKMLPPITDTFIKNINDAIHGNHDLMDVLADEFPAATNTKLWEEEKDAIASIPEKCYINCIHFELG
jgi:hypothetical protein